MEPRDFHQAKVVVLKRRDGRSLDGILYEPEPWVPPIATVVYLHGKGGSCLNGAGRFIPNISRTRPIRHLAVNMTCHDLGYTVPGLSYQDLEHGGLTAVDGGYWEKLHDGWRDVQAAVDFCQGQGTEPVFLVGKSSGGFYVADYCAREDGITGRVLLSPVISNKRVLDFWFETPAERSRMLELAREMSAEGRGHELIPVSKWFYAISADSLLERSTEPDGAFEKALASSDVPLLMLWGERETRSVRWREIFEEVKIENKTHRVVPGADHSYVGTERAVADAVCRFVEVTA